MLVTSGLFRVQAMQFAHHSRTVGPNDNLLREKREMRKYGMKRHFYDKLHMEHAPNPEVQ